MKLLKKTVPLWAVLLVVVLSASAVVAAIMISKDVSTPLTIEGQYNMVVLDTDKTTELTMLDLGTLHKGDVVTYPANPEASPFWIKNTGDYDLYISAEVVGSPTEVYYQVFYRPGVTKEWEMLNTADEIYPTQIGPNGFGQWYIKITVNSNAVFGTYPITLSWRGHSTATE